MRKWIVVVVIFIGFIGIATFILGKVPKKNEQVDVLQNSPQSPTNIPSGSDNSSGPATNSRYITYTNANLESTSEFRRVLFFYASWCPTCRPVDESLSQNTSQIPDDIRILRVNYNDPDTDNDEKSLARKYGVTYQHTFVQIDSDGNELTKWNGGSLNEIISNIQ